MRQRKRWNDSVVTVSVSRRFAELDFDLFDYIADLTEESRNKLGAFIEDYWKANSPATLGARYALGLISGWIHVLREHADEMAARLLAYITDVRNYDAKCRAYGPSEVTRQRQLATAIYPEIADDPLAGYPVGGEGLHPKPLPREKIEAAKPRPKTFNELLEANQRYFAASRHMKESTDVSDSSSDI